MWKILKQTENVKMNLGLCDISNKIYVKSKAKHLSPHISNICAYSLIDIRMH